LFPYFSSWAELLNIANSFTLPAVSTYVEDTLARRFEEFIETSWFLDTDEDVLERVTARDCLVVRSERYLLTQIDRWIGAAPRPITELTGLSVLETVRFGLMSSDELRPLLRRTRPYHSRIRTLIESALRYHADFSNGTLVKPSVQNRIRSVEPCIVLVLEGGMNQSYELVACQSLAGARGKFYSLYTDAAHHRTCGVVTLDNYLYIISLEHYGGFDHDSSVMLNCFDPRACNQRLLPAPHTQVVPSGRGSKDD